MKRSVVVWLVFVLLLGSAFANEEPAEPISYCEFITVVVQALDGNQPIAVEGHYASNYMNKAKTMGLIGDVSIEKWEQPIPIIDKELILSKAKEYLTDKNVTYDELRAVVNSRIISKVVINRETLLIKTAHRNGEIMLPLRAVSEQIGYTVGWSSQEQAAIISNGQFTFVLKINVNSYGYIDETNQTQSEAIGLASAPVLINHTTYVPVQFFNLIASYGIEKHTLTIYPDNLEN